MKKRAGFVVIVALTAIVFCFLGWRLWPHTFSALTSFDENSVASFWIQAVVRQYEDEQAYNDTYYCIDVEQPQDNKLDEILKILNTSNYQQDYRNLLPGDIDTVHPDKNYDGNTVELCYAWGSEPDEYISVRFLSSSTIAVFIGGESGLHIYHPTNHETLYHLVEYLKVHGTVTTVSYP
ncbi:MAG: hypothetical protein E7487_11695 [Ruminococcaceae bacterium]|nr:hypothetical protein [Oscillospiraceae bacterium]